MNLEEPIPGESAAQAASLMGVCQERACDPSQELSVNRKGKAILTREGEGA